MTLSLRPPLTKGEFQWLLRKHDGQTLQDYAASHKLTRAAITLAESDTSPMCPQIDLPITDLLRVIRLRDKRSRDELAACLGISHVTWLKWEHDADPRLVQFWEKHHE